MTFLQAPRNIPMQCVTPTQVYQPGRKFRVSTFEGFQTARCTYLYLEREKQLIQVYPFNPENTMPVDGFQIVQLGLYPLPGE